MLDATVTNKLWVLVGAPNIGVTVLHASFANREHKRCVGQLKRLNRIRKGAYLKRHLFGHLHPSIGGGQGSLAARPPRCTRESKPALSDQSRDLLESISIGPFVGPSHSFATYGVAPRTGDGPSTAELPPAAMASCSSAHSRPNSSKSSRAFSLATTISIGLDGLERRNHLYRLSYASNGILIMYLLRDATTDIIRIGWHDLQQVTLVGQHHALRASTC